jgi:uncharacterized repeat protein (TIGR02543 family)
MQKKSLCLLFCLTLTGCDWFSAPASSSPTTSASGSSSSSESSSSSSLPSECIVSFLNYDQTLLEKDVVAYGGTVEYRGDTPVGPAKSAYVYTFSGWNDTLENITSNCSRIAQYSTEAATYDVRFLNYDGAELQKSTVEYGAYAAYSGDVPERPKTEEKTFAFSNWDKDPTTTKIVYDTVFIAQYSEAVNSYKATFRNWDYSLLEEHDVPYDGTAVYGGETPTRAADLKYTYAFENWDLPLEHIRHDTTFVANFVETGKEYKATYIFADGATQDESRTYHYGEEVVLPTAPTYQGHLFLGWEINGVKQKDGPWCFTEDVTATAHWVQKQYQLDLDYGYDDKKESSTVSYGSDFVVPTLTRPGYTFSGFYEGANKLTSGKWLFEHDVKATAVWKTNEYTLTLDYGFNGIKFTQTIMFRDDFTLYDPTRTGYTFLGWYLDGKKITSTKYIYPQDTTFVATWSPISCTVTLNLNGGTLVDASASLTQTVAFDTLPTFPVCSDLGTRKFAGWYYQTNTKVADATGASVSPWSYTENITLTAEFYTDIENKAQLAAISDGSLKYRLMNDLDLSGEEWTPVPVMLQGELNGMNHVISGLTITTAGTSVGLFTTVRCWVQNLTITKANIAFAPKNSANAGFIAGTSYLSMAKNINVTDSSVALDLVNKPDVNCGALFGFSRGTSYNDCHVHSDVSVGQFLAGVYQNDCGGLVGEDSGQDKHTYVNCSNAGIITGWRAGGLVGYNQNYFDGTSCFNTANISGGAVGGIIGAGLYAIGGGGYTLNTSFVYNSGNITGSTNAGGIISGVNGDFSGGTMTSTWNSGSVTGNGNVGGFSGETVAAVVSDCYNSGSLSDKANNYFGGLFGITYNAITLTHCYNSGNMTFTGLASNGSFATGGLIGLAKTATANGCLNMGNIITNNTSYEMERCNLEFC